MTPAAEPLPLDRQRFVLDLHALAALLRNSDMVALEAHALIKRTYGAQVPELAPLDAAMAMLDFATAKTQCDALTAEFEKTP